MITSVRISADIEIEGHKFNVVYVSDDVFGPDLEINPETPEADSWYSGSDLNYVLVHLEASKALKSELFERHYTMELDRLRN